MSIARVLLATDVLALKQASGSGPLPLPRSTYSVSGFSSKQASGRYDFNASASIRAFYDIGDNSVSCCLQCSSQRDVSARSVKVWISGGSHHFSSRYNSLQLTGGSSNRVSDAMRIAINGDEITALCTKQGTDRIYVMFSGYLVFSDIDMVAVSSVKCETVKVPESLLFSEQHISHPATVTGAKRLPSHGVNLASAFEVEPFKQDSITIFVVKCGDKEFHVHDGILAGRSEFLKKMLGVNMAEKKEKKLVLDPESFGAEVVQKFLTKLYDTGFEISVDNIAELSVLLKLFHMYGIQDAVEECGKLLELQLHGDLGNVFTVLRDSHLCGLDDVFAKAVDKLRGMGADIWNRPEMVELGPGVLAAALQAACHK